MKFKLILFSVLTSVAAGSLAFASDSSGGTTAGDGGHGVQCGSSNNFTIEVLDIFEGRYVYGSNPSFLAPQTPLSPCYDCALIYMKAREIQELIRRAQYALGSGHPFLKTLEALYSMHLNIRVYHDSIKGTVDYGAINITRPAPYSVCEIIQLAKRGVDHDHLIYYEINYYFYSKLSYINRVALLLHESLHAWFDRSKPINTEVRQAVIYLLGSQMYRERNRLQFLELVDTKVALPNEAFVSDSGL